jgi:hypothetical protein
MALLGLARISTALVLFFSSFILVCTARADSMISTIQVGNSKIDVTIEDGPLAVSHADLLEWVRWAAESVSTYYRRYPVAHVSLHIIPFEGNGVRGGKTFPDGDNAGMIRIRVGSQTTLSDLHSDWMLTHEMVHLAFPSVAENHHWIEEGIATYVEPIARVRAGHFDPSIMWAEVVRDMPQGLPAPGDAGLDNTHTWGRTYWGGALFCLLADVEIHRETHNRKGLEDALRGILGAGGNISQDWDLEKALSAGDRATGVPVLARLYEKMKATPVNVDLNALWKQLGIERQDDRALFDDHAPLAAVRKAITFGKAAASSAPAANLVPSAIIVGRR